jgi:DNA repair protein RecO (recombination protein O)
MEWLDTGVIVAIRRFGESSLILSLLTRDHGRHSGLLRASRRQGGLQPGTAVNAQWRSRLADNLGTLRCEVTRPVPLAVLDDPGRLAALAAACAVVETALPEREAHGQVLAGLEQLLDHLAGGEGWGEAYVRWELDLLRELGYGLDLARCAVTGESRGLRYVSPRSGRAVTAAAGAPYAGRLLALPAFVTEPEVPSPAADVGAGLALTGYFLGRFVYGGRGQGLPPARLRLAHRFAPGDPQQP